MRVCDRCGRDLPAAAVRDVWLGLWSKGRTGRTPDLAYGARSLCGECLRTLGTALEGLGFTIVRKAFMPLEH